MKIGTLANEKFTLVSFITKLKKVDQVSWSHLHDFFFDVISSFPSNIKMLTMTFLTKKFFCNDIQTVIVRHLHKAKDDLNFLFIENFPAGCLKILSELTLKFHDNTYMRFSFKRAQRLRRWKLFDFIKKGILFRCRQGDFLEPFSATLPLRTSFS